MTPARLIFAGDGPTAEQALKHLITRPEIQVVGLMLHSAEVARCPATMRSLAPMAEVLEGDAINSLDGRNKVLALAPDWLISLNYAEILGAEALELVPAGHAINIHTGLLPEQRGRYPNFWAILSGGNGGVTMHVMTAGVDEGHVLVRRELKTDWTDTAATLYDRLQQAALRVLEDNLAPLLSGKLAPIPQTGSWPTRRRSEFLALRRIDLDAPTTARALLNRLRAFSFPGDAGAMFEDGGERFSVAITITRTENPQ